MKRELSDPMTNVASPFATTHWSVVLCAGEAGTPEAEAALEKLCLTYWPPLYAYLRRTGHQPADAEDLTQAFFQRLLSDGRLKTAQRCRGRFRTFLLSSLKNFLVNEWRRTNRLKRGSGSVHLSLDCSPEEEIYAREPATLESPDLLFERRWAKKLVDQALEMVRQDYLRARQVELYEAVMPVVWGDADTKTYSQIAASLGTTEGAFKVAVFRARQRIGDRIRETVASTVSDPSDGYEIDAEMQHLQDILKGRMPNQD